MYISTCEFGKPPVRLASNIDKTYAILTIRKLLLVFKNNHKSH